ncbi:APC family permease [Psychrobacter sp. NG254]|uniref:APC family permease n=1 Tax=Psychrobacter sp. NG254 TaxID=2782003 RepID=UPI001888058A|nr:APC family permease [Psychrobacter sp. NG254]MBF2719089.1 APC family permease [Psychrobacter sp. NG254]
MSEKTESISYLQAIAISVGAIIGWGAYVMPGDLFLPQSQLLGSSVAIIIGTLAIYMVARAYIHLLTQTPETESGGIYWIEKYINRKHAYIYGWGVTIGYISIIALNISAVALLLRYLLPSGLQLGYLYTIAGWEVYASEVFLCSAAIILFSYINLKGVRVGAKIQLYIALFMILSVTALFFASLWMAPTSQAFLPTDMSSGSITSLAWLPILAVMPWAYVGFETTPQISKAISDSKTKTKSIILISLIAGILFYFLINYFTALNMSFDYQAIKDSHWATGEGIDNRIGSIGIWLLSIAMIGSIMSGINGFILSSVKLLESMGDTSLLPNVFTDKNNQFSKQKTVTLICLVCLLSPWLGRNYLLDIVTMASLGITVGFAYVTTADLINERKKKQAGLLNYLSVLISVVFISLLLLPFSPAALSFNAYVLLGFFIVLGMIGYRKIMPVQKVAP